MAGENWCTIKDLQAPFPVLKTGDVDLFLLSPIPSSQDWGCGPSSCTHVLILLRCDRCDRCVLVFILY